MVLGQRHMTKETITFHTIHGSIGHCGILYLDMHKKSPVTCYLQPWNNDKDRSVIYEPNVEEGDIVVIPQHIVHLQDLTLCHLKKNYIF